MKLKSLVTGRVGTIVLAGLVAASVGTGASVAAGQITSAQIKDGTIQTGDLTKNNFARFTSTENVVTADTAVSTNPAFGGQRVVDLAATGTTALATLVLDKGTWKISGVGQFRHFTGNPTDPDFGVITVNGLQSGFATNYTADIPNGGANAAQTSFSGTIVITANDTPVIVYGSINGAVNGQAGASVSATQYKYVKLFKGGQPG